MNTYQIRQTIQLLPHQAALVPPPSYLAVHEIKEQPERHESQSGPHVTVGVGGTEAVPHRAKYGHEAAKTCRDRSR